jgi:hypothetical protein
MQKMMAFLPLRGRGIDFVISKSSVSFPLNRMKRGLRDLTIDAYRMAAVFRRELFPRRVDPNQVGFPVRHMTIDAIVHQLRADLGRDFTLDGLLRALMARKAFLSVPDQIPLLLMDVVAGRAGHRRAGAKTLALAQERNLIAVNVSAWIGFARSGWSIFVQPLTRPI